MARQPRRERDSWDASLALDTRPRSAAGAARRCPMSNVTASHGDLPRPWPAPGPDAGWWHGPTPDAASAEQPTGVPERPLRPRHRPAAATTVTPVWEPREDDRPEWAIKTLRAMRPGRRPTSGGAPAPRKRKTRVPRHPLPGLVALVLLALLAAFFAWFSAEPLWLSLGHGTAGVAKVGTCETHGITRRCVDFTAERDGFVAGKVTLLGTGPVQPGGTIQARMVSATGSAAYAGSSAWRWLPSLVGVLACGFGIAWLTGAYRLPGRRRLTGLALSLAGPLALTAGMLAVTW